MANDSSPTEMLDVVGLVATVLERLNVAWMIGGSVASSIHGDPRATRDVDLVTALGLEHADPFVTALGDTFYVDRSAVDRAVRNTSSFNLIHFDTMVKVDIFVVRTDAVSRWQLERRERRLIQGHSLYVATAEDTVLAKLSWYARGGCVSDRQWSDILGILKVRRAELDLAYLRTAAEAWSLDALLRRALDDAGWPPST